MAIDLNELRARFTTLFHQQGISLLEQPERLQAWLMDILPQNWQMLMDIIQSLGHPKDFSDQSLVTFDIMMKYASVPADELKALADLWLQLKWEDFPLKGFPPNQTLLDDQLYQSLMEKLHQRGMKWST